MLWSGPAYKGSIHGARRDSSPYDTTIALRHRRLRPRQVPAYSSSTGGLGDEERRYAVARADGATEENERRATTPHDRAEPRTAGASRQAGRDVALDADDPQLYRYNAHRVAMVSVGPRQSFIAWTNEIAVGHADRYDFVGSMGDDHLPRTPGWDKLVCEALDELGTGVAYGDDLAGTPVLPSAAAAAGGMGSGSVTGAFRNPYATIGSL